MKAQEGARFSSINAIKADFNHIYRAKDPCSYFKVLGELGYIIPEIAAPALMQLVERLIGSKGRPITVLDVGCSYGILAAVMRYGLTIHQLHDRYIAAPLQAPGSDRLASYDAHYFAGWPRRDDVRFIGLDCSAEAIAYALKVGLIDEGLVIDLGSVVSKVDLIVSTGAVGYISEKTSAKLLRAFPSGQEPWIASFVLRMFDYGNIAEIISQHGLETECLDEVTFVQRRVRDEAEFEDALRLIQARGIDPAGKEAEGVYLAELFVSRPSSDIRVASLRDLVRPAHAPSRETVLRSRN